MGVRSSMTGQVDLRIAHAAAMVVTMTLASRRFLTALQMDIVTHKRKLMQERLAMVGLLAVAIMVPQTTLALLMTMISVFTLMLVLQFLFDTLLWQRVQQFLIECWMTLGFCAR